jgi:hypothetical protein
MSEKDKGHAGAYISGRHTCCADPACAYRGTLKVVRESWDAPARCIVGEEHCPSCGCMMLYSRKLTREEKIEWGNNGEGLVHLTLLHPQFVIPTPCPTCGGRTYNAICQNYGCEGLLPDYPIEWPAWTTS